MLTYPAHPSFIQQLGKLNLGQMWSEVKAPVLVLYGQSDFVTSAEEHRYLANLLNRTRPGSATLVEVPRLDHHFQVASSQAESFERVRTGGQGQMDLSFGKTVVEWLKKQVS